MASQLGLQVDVIEVRAPEEASAAVARAKQLGAEGLLVLGDAVLNTPPSRVPDLLAGAAIPALYSSREPVLAGGLISYTPDSTAIARRHAHYVDRLLRGHLPTDLPVEQPTRYNLTVNLRTAAALGLILPQSLMSRADEVIE
jgi:putative ABC transport system substrate-binding protein